jgi:hypothetical protein
VASRQPSGNGVDVERFLRNQYRCRATSDSCAGCQVTCVTPHDFEHHHSVM